MNDLWQKSWQFLNKPILKTCLECKKDLPRSKFNSRKENTKHNGELRNNCIDCGRLYQQKYNLERNERKRKITEKASYELETGMRICIKCEDPKLLNSDNFLVHHQGGAFQNTCRFCSGTICSENYRIRQEEISKLSIEEQDIIANEKYLKSKEYREDNKEQEQKRHKEYNSKETTKEQRRNRENERLKTDPAFKLKKNVSISIRNGIKNNKGNKNGESAWTFLPYTPDVLRQHLQGLFEPWMSWDNWTMYDPYTWDDNDQTTWTWNIDHITPQSKLPYKSMQEENFQRCWKLDNLRPYSAKQNISDGNRD